MIRKEWQEFHNSHWQLREKFWGRRPLVLVAFYCIHSQIVCVWGGVTSTIHILHRDCWHEGETLNVFVPQKRPLLVSSCLRFVSRLQRRQWPQGSLLGLCLVGGLSANHDCLGCDWLGGWAAGQLDSGLWVLRVYLWLESTALHIQLTRAA